MPDCGVISGTVCASLLARDTNQCAISFLLPYVREDMKIHSVVIVSFFVCVLSAFKPTSYFKHYGASSNFPWRAFSNELEIIFCYSSAVLFTSSLNDFLVCLN